VLALAVLLVAVGIGTAIAVSRDGGGAPGSVQVAGVSVDGKDRAEIAGIVRERAKDLAKEQIVVTRTDDPGVRVAATRAELGARMTDRQRVGDLHQEK